MGWTMDRRVLLGLLLLAVVCLPTEARASDLEVEANLSWASAAQPILHVLVKNNGDRARTLKVIAPEVLSCGGKEMRADPRHYSGCVGGAPALASREFGTRLIAVRENACAVGTDIDQLILTEAVTVRSYAEAIGAVVARRVGVALEHITGELNSLRQIV